MLRAIVITPNQRTRELGDLLAIARSEAQKREHTHKNVNIKALGFFAQLQVYVAIYEVPDGKRGG